MEEINVFGSIMSGLSESLEYAKGKSNKARKTSVTIADLPSYNAFVLGVSPKNIEAWETGRNVPQGIAQRLLQMLQVGGKKMLQDFKVIDFAR